MKPIRLAPMRLARRLKQFNLSLLATLAALAMTACSADVPVPPPAATSLSQGVQQTLHAQGSPMAADGTHVALATPH